MSAIIDIGRIDLPPSAAAGYAASVHPTINGDSTLSPDTVEFSATARRLAAAMEPSRFRLVRLRAIRAEIESGAYETPARLEGAVRRLLDVLG
jgi:hypothetical protein